MLAAAVEHIAERIAVQGVDEVRAGDVLDGDQLVIIGIAARAGPGGEVDHHAGGRRRIARAIGADAAIERVGAAETDEAVIADAAAQHVGDGRAGQRIRKRRTGDVLDVDQCVASRIAAEAECDAARAARGIVTAAAELA